MDARGLASAGVVESLLHTVTDREVIIDLRNVTLLESSAIVALRGLFEAASSAEGRLFVSGASPDVRQMFRMAQLGAPATLMDDGALVARVTGEVDGDD